MSALTDEQNGAVEPVVEAPASTAGPGTGTEGTSTPLTLTLDQIKANPELYSEFDRRVAADSAARFERDRRLHEQERLAEINRADDERWQKLSVHQVLAKDGRADPLDPEDEAWFNDHGRTRAQREVFNAWMNDYEQARRTNQHIPSWQEYAGRPTGELIEAIFQAGRASREPDIEAEAKKRAVAMTAEEMDQLRATLPGPEVTRTSGRAGGGPNSLGDLMALSTEDRLAFRRDNPTRYNQLTAQATRG